MAKKIAPIPEGLSTITPHLFIKGAAKAIEFYKQAFGAKVRGVMPAGPDGKIMHAEIRIGDSPLMLCDECPEMGANAPGSGGSPVTIHLYLKNVDDVWNRAVAAGATVRMPLADMFWGDRYGKLQDPFGHVWSLATHQKDLSDKEIAAAGAAAMSEMSSGVQECGDVCATSPTSTAAASSKSAAKPTASKSGAKKPSPVKAKAARR